MQTSADRPRFRQDLVAEPIDDGDARFIDVMDPDSGQLFRFYEVEYSLACAMDGQRDVAGIVKWAEEELGLKPSPSEVRTVIATLGDLGYLERGADAAAAASAPLTEPAAPTRAASSSAQPTPASSPQPHAGGPTSRPTTPPGGVPTSTPPSDTPAVKKQPEASAFNRWDQPTAMGDSGEYLDKIAAKRGSDVELGAPGPRRDASDELPRAPELELGAPGSTGAAAASKQRAGDDIALGASGAAGAANVSTDLAVDVPVRRDDVKEAVRAAHGHAPEAAKAATKADAKPAAKAETKPADTRPAETKPVEAKPAAKAETKPAEAKKPSEMPTDRPVLPTAPTAPSSGVSPILIGLLVLVVLGAGGFLVYKYVLKKDRGETSATTPPPPPRQPEPVPVPVPIETAKLALEQPDPQEIKPTAAGQLAAIVATDTAVKAGEPIARLVGFQPVQNQVTALQKEIDKATTDIAKLETDRDAAVANNNTAAATAAETKLAAAQKSLADRSAKLAAQTSALDKFLIKAPVDGKVTAVAKANARISPTDIIATLTPDPVLVATFKSAGEAAPDAKVLLAVTGSEHKLACTVIESGEDGVKIACPQQDGGFEGAEVTFAGLDPAYAGQNDAPAPGDKPVEPAPATGAPDDVEAPAGASTPKPIAPKGPARPAPEPQQPPASETQSELPLGTEPTPAPAQ